MQLNAKLRVPKVSPCCTATLSREPSCSSLSVANEAMRCYQAFHTRLDALAKLSCSKKGKN